MSKKMLIKSCKIYRVLHKIDLFLLNNRIFLGKSLMLICLISSMLESWMKLMNYNYIMEISLKLILMSKYSIEIYTLYSKIALKLSKNRIILDNLFFI